MNRTFTKLCVIAVLGICIPGFAEPAVDLAPKQIRVTAVNEEFHPETQEFTAEGSAKIVYGDITLTADQVTGNADSGEVEATGHVHFQNAARSLTGNTFKYNFKTDVGLATNANAGSDHMYFRGAEMKSEPGKYTLKDSRFTSCDLENPHYYITARELVIEPNKMLTAKGVSLVMYGKTLFRLPTYHARLGPHKRKTGLRLPNIGVERSGGFFAGYGFDLDHSLDTQDTLDVRLSTKWLFQGGLKYESIAGGPAFGRLTYREPYYGGSEKNLIVTRLPEVGFRFGAQAADQQYSSTNESLTLSRGLISPLEIEPKAARVSFVGEVGAGEFREEPDPVTSWRLDARALSWLKPIDLGGNVFFAPGVSGRMSCYEGGNIYSDLGLRLAVAKRLGSKSYVSVGYIAHSVHGATPFHFDAVDLRDEFAARVGFPVGEYTLELGGRYDLNNHGIFDTEVSIAKTVHCLEPKITWSKRFSQMSLGIGVVGF